MRRSLATTFITLLPVASLLIFGGETLKDFAFALLIGIGSGAYSSIFIAAPAARLLEGARARVRAAEGHRRRRGLEGGVGALPTREPVAGQQPAASPVEAEAAPVRAAPRARSRLHGGGRRRRARRTAARSAASGAARRPHGRAR